jgi:crotonobetainyl-CoA:carnitine CoA-transferase CaiB-like acyl-CoA transferase
VLPLSPLLVLDLTAFRAGPTAVRQLGDWGARVIKVEAPPGNRAVRLHSDAFNLARNSESLTLDLKQEAAREAFFRLVSRADVLVENHRPGTTARLGVDYAACRARNPRLVYASLSGFGQEGPWAGRPGFDQVAQGMSGLMSVTGTRESGPLRAGIAVADSASGLYLAFGIVAALLRRERTGAGAWVRTSLLESLLALTDFQAARWLVEGEVPGPQGNHHPVIVPMGTYPASDAPFNLAAGNDAMFASVCRVLDVPELATQPEYATIPARVRRRAELNARLEERTRTRPAAHWIEALTAAGVPAGPILRVDEAWAHPQVEALGLAQPVEHPERGPVRVVGQPLTFADLPGERGVRRRAPLPGEHTDAILEELGYTQDEIAALRAQGAV